MEGGFPSSIIKRCIIRRTIMESFVTNYFSVSFFIMAGCVVAIMVGYIVYRFIKDHASPKIITSAKVKTKKIHKVKNVDRNNWGHHITYNHLYYITFQLESGDTIPLLIRKRIEYERLHEGDQGKLTFQGKRYIHFQKSDDISKGTMVYD